MYAKRIGAALALTAMLVPVASQAADTVIGTVASGTDALVARDGKVLPAVAGMRLYRGDRVITRLGGEADVRLANNCAVTVGASSLLAVSSSSCANSKAVNFDEGRAGYTGSSSAFADHNGFPVVLAAFFAAFGGALYYILHHPRSNPSPVSP